MHLTKIDRRPLPDKTAEQWRRSTMFADQIDDILEMLPEPAREKLIAIRAEADQLRAAAKSPYERAKELTGKKNDIERRISELLRGNYNEINDSHPLVVAEREALEATKSEIFRLQHQADTLRPAADEAGRLVTYLHDYIKTTGPRLATVSLAPETPTPKPAKGIVDSIARTRERIANLATEIRATEDAPITSEEAKSIARAHIERIAERGRPNVLPVLEARLPPEMPRPYQQRYPDEIDVQSLFAWLHKDKLVEALEREIDTHAADDAALSDAERAKRIAAFSSERLALERAEESLIALARQNFNPIARRADADPRAVLGLADSAPVPRTDY